MLVLLAVAAYHNSFEVPFLFDDVPSIVENPALDRPAALASVLGSGQPGGLTTSGRPLLTVSFALNRAVSGDAVWSYHAVNLALHAAASLLLFGIVRRTLLLPPCRAGSPGEGGRVDVPKPAASPAAGHLLLAAWFSAAVWLLHPLQTESVTYIVQRAESLAGLLYLATLYTFIRGARRGTVPPGDALRPGSTGVPPASTSRRAQNAGSPLWLPASVVLCTLGMAAKETLVTAPFVILLYDRTFLAGSLAGAWRARRGVYIGYAAALLVLAALVFSTSGRGGTAGFGAGVTPWQYLLTQCEAIVRYVALTAWPEPLVFDYGTALAPGIGAVAWQGLALCSALGLSVALWRRAPALTFGGLAFFALLAPSSSVVPVATQTAAEHRMYLALAVLATGLVLGVARVAGRAFPLLLAALASAFGIMTVARNQDYASEVTIWADTAAKRPESARAHNNLGQGLYRAGRKSEAERAYRRALELRPDYADPHYNLGVLLADRDEREAAISSYETALRLQPAYPQAENNLGNVLVAAGRAEEALAHYARALEWKPGFAEAENNWGNACLSLGRLEEAKRHLSRALELRPVYPEAHYNLGNARAADGAMEAALQHYRTALEQDPAYAAAHVNAGNALLALGRTDDALQSYRAALARQPGFLDARLNLGLALADLNRWDEAVTELSAVVDVAPDHARARRALAFGLVQVGRQNDARLHYREYLRQQPEDGEARAELRALGE